MKRSGMTRLLAVALIASSSLLAQQVKPAAADSDGDGLDDAQEQALLVQFAPKFLVSSNDCSVLPASFRASEATPTVVQENGTIYGQATPQRGINARDTVELHFYHLWRTDCGQMGHALDTEHVSALVQRHSSGEWKAVYWYAAAHEDTVCDASQITRAATIDAETHGPQVWISFGKHASYLDEQLCRSGCGGDRCTDPQALAPAAPVNLGESGAPMSGAVWIASSRWPLTEKMTRTDFTEPRLARLDRLPKSDIAWATPAKRPAQAAIYGGNSGIGGAATGVSAGGHALGVSSRETDTALVLAGSKTGSALGRSLHHVKGALGSAARHTGEALGVSDASNK